MAITKSAQKAHRQSARRKIRNVKAKTNLKDLLKEIKSFISQNKIKEAENILSKVQKTLDKAAKTDLIKKGTASRKKSRIARAILKAKSH
ncbi:MAG: 30S ribosomal protein S20 [Candidatus Nealsonbacteria bacterium]